MTVRADLTTNMIFKLKTSSYRSDELHLPKIIIFCWSTPVYARYFIPV